MTDADRDPWRTVAHLAAAVRQLATPDHTSPGTIRHTSTRSKDD